MLSIPAGHVSQHHRTHTFMIRTFITSFSRISALTAARLPVTQVRAVDLECIIKDSLYVSRVIICFSEVVLKTAGRSGPHPTHVSLARTGVHTPKRRLDFWSVQLRSLTDRQTDRQTTLLGQ